MRKNINRLHFSYQRLLEFYQRIGFTGSIATATYQLFDLEEICAEDRVILLHHMDANKPTPVRHEEFYHHPNYTDFGGYWWISFGGHDVEVCRQEKMKFLEKMIDETLPTMLEYKLYKVMKYLRKLCSR